jgi:hypothetical protein
VKKRIDCLFFKQVGYAFVCLFLVNSCQQEDFAEGDGIENKSFLLISS